MSEESRNAAKPVLNENDIPGASLHGRDPNSLKMPELKRWLTCRNASTKGKKSDLVLWLSVSVSFVKYI